MRHAVAGLSTILALAGCAAPEESAEKPVSGLLPPVTTPSGLVYQVLEEGGGPIATGGDIVLIHERTTLADGTVITDTWELNSPIRFHMGASQVIDGLDEAVNGMRVGERRSLVVPPSLSRRSSYPENGLFGPEDTLYYDVILLHVEKNPAPYLGGP